MDVRFSEFADAGFRALFTEEWRRVSVVKNIALSLRGDPTRNARPCNALGLERFWVRGFFAGIDVRVLFEIESDITVWSVAHASTLRPTTE